MLELDMNVKNMKRKKNNNKFVCSNNAVLIKVIVINKL